MATRRSRLQVKPNILGGMKGPGTKSVPKAAGKDAESKECTVRAEAVDDKQTKVNSPISTTKEKSNKEEAEKVDLKKTAVIAEKDKDQSDGKNLEADAKGADLSKTDLPALPTRARLRKFGTVNISAARGLKSESLLAKTEKEQSEESKSEKLECDSDKTNEGNKEDSGAEKINTKNVPKTNAVIQRRSRFPKAKPNLADAGRRKVKEPPNKEETSNDSVSESQKKVPEISVTEPIKEEKKVHKIKAETSESLQSTPTLTQLQPRPPGTPISSILKSPLKHPTPTIPVSPEKRARTLSTSEPPVVKRQKKPKVTAPTDQPPDRTTMKMKDLIRWNPINNPMKPKVKTGTAAVVKSAEKENLEDEIVTGEEVEKTVVENEPEPEDTDLPVPQVTIGPDGNIVINEKSLIVKGPEVGKEPEKNNDIIDETDIFTTYASFRTRNLSKRWSKKETRKFYKALAMIGIDFFLINQLFPNRTRLEIKKKFKKEEKVNKALVDKVLKERINFDPTFFDTIEKSSDEEEKEDKIEKKKKEKEKKTTTKEQKITKTTTKKKASKRKRANKNYFEDDTTSEEEDPVPQKSNKSAAGPSVSQTDGEVVDILMDMSKGRIRGQGYNSGNLDMSGKLTAIPANKVHKNASYILREANTTSSVLPDDKNVTFENVPVDIPGIQSISIMQAQKIEAGNSMKTPVQNFEGSSVNTNLGTMNQNINYSNSDSSNRRIYLPDLSKTYSPGQSNMQRNDSISNQVQYNQIGNTPSAEIGGSSSHLQPGTNFTELQGTNQSQLQPGTSFSQFQPGTIQSQLPQLQVNTTSVNDNSQVNAEDADQYVLVTVMPEGGGETVIHIYRLHGGGQTQNQVLYADQQTTENGNIVSEQQHDQTSSSLSLSFSESQIMDTSTLNTTDSDITAEVIREISNASALQSSVGETSGDGQLILTQVSNAISQTSSETSQIGLQLKSDSEKLLMLQTYVPSQSTSEQVLKESVGQNTIKNEIETDTKTDIVGKVGEMIVTHGIQSDTNLTNLNSHEVEIENR